MLISRSHRVSKCIHTRSEYGNTQNKHTEHVNNKQANTGKSIGHKTDKYSSNYNVPAVPTASISVCTSTSCTPERRNEVVVAVER